MKMQWLGKLHIVDRRAMKIIKKKRMNEEWREMIHNQTLKSQSVFFFHGGHQGCSKYDGNHEICQQGTERIT